MPSLSKYDCWGNDEAVCPHCGTEYEYSYGEFMYGDQDRPREITCLHCRRVYRAWRRVEITYDTEPLEGWEP